MKKPTIVPAVLSSSISDYTKYTEEFSKFSKLIHIDIMDGVFVLEKSPTAEEVFIAIDENIKAEYSVHLMVSEPKPILEELSKYKHIKLVYVHAEVLDDEILSNKYPFEIAAVIDPDTDLKEYSWLLLKTDVIQVMTIFPGRQGSPFIPESLEQIQRLRNLGFEGEIHADGHINEETIITIVQHGVHVLNVGSAFTKSEDPAKTFIKLQQLCTVAD
jgi:ribulose-phosphate 3-epimerase